MYFARIMYQYTQFTYKVGMAIFNLEVKDFDGFGEFQEVNTADSCGVPVLGVDNIAGNEVACIYPALTLYLERVGLGTLDDLTVNILRIIMAYSLRPVNKKLRTWRNSEEFFQVRRENYKKLIYCNFFRADRFSCEKTLLIFPRTDTSILSFAPQFKIYKFESCW